MKDPPPIGTGIGTKNHGGDHRRPPLEASSIAEADDIIDRNAGDDDHDGQLVTVSQLVERVEAALPLDEKKKSGVVQVIGYGSGVFDQKQKQQRSKARSKSKSMSSSDATTTALPPHVDVDDDTDAPLIDLIVVVNDAVNFHQHNYRKNPSHYNDATPIRWWSKSGTSNAALDSSTATARAVAHRAAYIQRHSLPAWMSSIATNPGAYYVVDNDQHRIKYGVIHQDDLLDDLSMWTYLYVAGRLHKPTVTVYETMESQVIRQAQQSKNVPAALSTALLLLMSKSYSSSSGVHDVVVHVDVEERSVYETIAGLSYAGDFRMQLGAEDPAKIRNLVGGPGSLARFRNLYKDAAIELQSRGLLSIESSSSASSSLQWTWDTSDGARQALANQLPPRLRELVVLRGPPSILKHELQRIVAPAARYQSLKGLVTAGSFTTSIKYALRKLRKGWRA